ncbi:MAG: hypothetical protein J6S67_10720 [Methanobrevibacter sp.]|nr:hypothetical protein [Methanobrevibacter sp.]
MNNIYDNGDQLIGKCGDIKKYNDRVYKENILDEDTYNELKEELKEIDDESIIMIDYSCGMGLYIRVWEKDEVIK